MIVAKRFLVALPVLLFASSAARVALSADEPRKFEAGRWIEISATSSRAGYDLKRPPVDFIFTEPDGHELVVPAFWAGGSDWKVRYTSRKLGTHQYRAAVDDPDEEKLRAATGEVEVVPYRGSNPLFARGALRVAADRRHFMHEDGTPFLWLGDTWWMGFTKRLHWPDEFHRLTADRKEKGFNVVHIVGGLYPDMPAFDDRGANEAGFPWEKEYTALRPEYFDMADRRMFYLVDQGFVPCLVAGWGYHLPLLGVERMKLHWRNLIARYGALPVVWCLAGEGSMPYYLSKEKEKDKAFLRHGWTEVARYVRNIDPYHRLLTVHPPDSARNVVEDLSVLDFDMLQTGHGDKWSLAPTLKAVRASIAAKPTMPTVNGEVCYEGILGTCHADLQRFIIWGCLLSGEAGHTYGANGIWQVNRREKPYGNSPLGNNWGTTPWDDAMNLPGSRQTGLAKKVLERFEWTKFEPHNEWVSLRVPPKHKESQDVEGPFCAGIPGKVRVAYMPKREPLLFQKLEAGARYRATYFNPQDGRQADAGGLESDEQGVAQLAPPPGWAGDWVAIALAADTERQQAASESNPENPSAKPAPRSSAAKRSASTREPFTLHPDNPKYFLFRGKPLALIAAGEHYGSVVNRAFDYRRYLRDAADKRQTMTRTFLLFREQQSSRNPSSPVKPESPDFITPYVRSGPGAAIDGEPLYDLDRWNPEYFTRLHDFMRQASLHGVVVELTLFSNTYGDPVWGLNPLNGNNNRQKIGRVAWTDYNTLKVPALVERQKAFVRKIVSETSRYDNFYYEICNEPGGGAAAGSATPADVDAWQKEIAATVKSEMDRAGRRHLISGSQAFSYTPTFTQPLDASFDSEKLGRFFDAVNVHPLPGTVLGGRTWSLGNFMSKELKLEELAGFCRLARGLPKPCVLDEDNTASLYRDDTGWTIHRKRAWLALFSQAHYDYIDFSITAGSERGTAESQRKIRTWMKHLSQYFHSLDFIHLEGIDDLVESKPEHLVAAVLGRAGKEYVAYLADAREVTDATAGRPIAGALALRLPAGRWSVSLYAPTTGMSSPGILTESTGNTTRVELPPFTHDIVVRAARIEAGA